MRTLDLYLVRRFLLCLGLAVFGLLLLAVIIDLTENIDTFIDFEARPGHILFYYFYRLPYWLILTLPIAALLGSLFALTSLARHKQPNHRLGARSIVSWPRLHQSRRSGSF